MNCSLSLGLLLLTGCTPQLPGELLGTYRVEMRLGENTCGPNAVLLQDGKRYSVELREDQSRRRGYWHIADVPPIEGSLDAQGNFKFTYSSIVASEGLDAGPNGCTLVQDEVLAGSLRKALATDGGMEGADAGSASVDGLVGEHVMHISSYNGTDCSRALVAAGGPFEALPCHIRYTLSGKPREPL